MSSVAAAKERAKARTKKENYKKEMEELDKKDLDTFLHDMHHDGHAEGNVTVKHH